MGTGGSFFMFEILKSPMRNYFRLRVHNLNSDEFRHLKLLLYWPAFGILFYLAEQVIPLEACHEVYCRLDDYIPFVEYFVIPYVFWYVYLIGMHVYTLLYDVDAFRRLMKFIMITYTITLVIYILWPNCQMLRPSVFERDNLFTRFMEGFYTFDTNTNVCPSLHVAGSLAVCFTSWHCRGLNDTSSFSGKIIRHSFNIAAILISVSTVFLKQHSVIDIAAAVVLCVPAYWYCFRRKSDKYNE